MNRKIDTKKLSVGMTVKNYKALCELLSQDVKTGNSKKYIRIDCCKNRRLFG